MHDSSKQFPSLNCVWDQNDSLRLPTLLCAELDKKGWESVSPTSTRGQALCCTETGYTAWSKLLSHWPFPSSRLYSQLFCTCNKRKNLSQMQEVWCGTVPWWVFSRSPYKIETVFYQEVMTGHQKLRTSHQISTWQKIFTLLSFLHCASK